jgi:outer membrane lipoprotein-sorting protein
MRLLRTRKLWSGQSCPQPAFSRRGRVKRGCSQLRHIWFLFLVPLAMGDSVIQQPQSLTLEQIIHQMDLHDQAMTGSPAQYTCLRRYALENKRFHKKAEISVRMTYTSPGHKKFEVLSEQGPSVIRQKVLKPMLEAEEESSRDDIRPRTRFVAANYDFKLLGRQVQQGRAAYLLEVTPKTRNKFLIRGKVWIDAKDFGVIRVEASPAQNPSLFIHNTRVIQQSTLFGDVWLPLFNHSNTDSFLFGHTEVTIDSWDYKITGPQFTQLLPPGN